MQHTARSLGDVSLCKRHECRGCEPLPQPTDRTSAELWLRSHARDLSLMSRLRRIVAGEGFGAGLSRLSDDRVRAHVAQMLADGALLVCGRRLGEDRKSTRLNSSHTVISYAVFCLKKKKRHPRRHTCR